MPQNTNNTKSASKKNSKAKAGGSKKKEKKSSKVDKPTSDIDHSSDGHNSTEEDVHDNELETVHKPDTDEMHENSTDQVVVEAEVHTDDCGDGSATVKTSDVETDEVVVETEAHTHDSEDGSATTTTSNGETDESSVEIGVQTFKQVIETITVTKKTLAGLLAQVKGLEKWAKKLDKSKRKKVYDPNKKPNTSGINKPYPIPELTQELKEFMGSDDGEMISRVDVLRHVCEYVKEHDLQNPEDKKKILPDDTLKAVFQDLKEDGAFLSYTTIMKHVTKHFPSSKKPN